MDATNYEIALKQSLRNKEDERLKFQTDVKLTIGDLEELLLLSLSCDLRTKLASAAREARRAYAVSKVDFGDLVED